ncbi:MAG: glutamine phosphoribosylpyrophosphate amidotransferase, partial [Candidatus Poribacteria bacterium]|nr:glutamine phosphoribosylpyrophosphate amidotransferase [Candidatus Poribacteria bacterium]
FLDKTKSRTTVGKIVLQMLNALGARGPDSAGVALYGQKKDKGMVVQIKLGKQKEATLIVEQLEEFGSISEVKIVAEYLRLVISLEVDIASFLKVVESLDQGIEVVSLGAQLEVVKQVGTPKNLESTYNISSFTGTHGLGHTRLSTESRVDLSHSQPFWAYGYADLAIVHNGHITNYHTMRRLYEQRGIEFHTENDSEIIGIYFADQLSKGMVLQEVLEASLTDFDGSFSYLVSTPDSISFAKDPFAFKPLLFTETDDFVAIATEEIAIRSVFSGSYTVRESQSKEIHIWQK